MNIASATMASSRINTARNSRDLRIDLLISALAIVPLLVTVYPPMTDLPNHLARQHIIQEWAASPALQQYYRYKIALVPNLALDLFVFATATILPVDLGVRLFCILTVTLLFWGCRLANRELGGSHARAYRFAPFFCYGGPFQLGLVNFCFGIGLAVLVFGLYLRRRDAPPYKLIAIFLPCGFALLICHLAAFGLCAIAIGAFELALPTTPGGRFLIVRRELRVAAILLPPLLIFLLASPTAIGGYPAVWSTVEQRLEAVGALTMFARPIAELTLLGFAAAGFGIALLAGIVRVRRECVVMLLIMTAIFLALPRVALGGGYIDYRVPWAMSFFLLAGIAPGRRAGFAGRTTLIWFAGLGALRIALVTTQWLAGSAVISGIVDALRTLPTGARLYVILGNPNSVSKARRPPLEHVAAYAVAYRQAYWAGIFADITGQILFIQPGYIHDRGTSLPSATPRKLDPIYQFVLVLRPEFAVVAPDLGLVPLASGDEFQLLAVPNPIAPAR